MVLLLLCVSLAPVQAETPPAAGKPAPAAGPSVNVNSAGVDELASLPGIGPALAKRIVDFRKEKGPFRKPEDLLAVQGIGPKLLDRIRGRLSFDAPADRRG
ncbi:MAG: helix-hairpin-helix domain-containing protein [Acidobacteria bacterium]|nr:helix-hairpin-helix domain-containing protein [Acidobacteriota bacterium]